MDKPERIELTNNDNGPRFAFTSRGQEVVKMGETLTTEVSVDQLRDLRGQIIDGTDDAPRWTIDGSTADLDTGADQEKALESLPVAKLRQIAEAEGVPLSGRVDDDNKALPDITTKGEIISAIRAARTAREAGAGGPTT